MASYFGLQLNRLLAFVGCIAILIVSAGCAPSDNYMASDALPEEQDNLNLPIVEVSLNEFNQSGPAKPELDIDKLMQAKANFSQYHLIAGDVIKLIMPTILSSLDPVSVSTATGLAEPYICRVNPNGQIPLPIIGQVPAAGKTLSQLEQTIISKYYPRYVYNPPSVVASVIQYQTSHITVLGAVNTPGIVNCRSNELSLVNAIMKSGGIVDQGAAVITVNRANQSNQPSEMITLPVKGLNVPFTDIALMDGDTIEVQQLTPQVFTVIGLVNRSGVFDYPPGTSYNLMQALAFAGGVNEIAAPAFARVYRQDNTGRIVTTKFALQGSSPKHAAALSIKPGDIVAVEQTVSTKTRLFLSQVFQLSTGLNATAIYRFDNARLQVD